MNFTVQNLTAFAAPAGANSTEYLIFLFWQLCLVVVNISLYIVAATNVAKLRNQEQERQVAEEDRALREGDRFNREAERKRAEELRLAEEEFRSRCEDERVKAHEERVANDRDREQHLLALERMVLHLVETCRGNYSPLRQ